LDATWQHANECLRLNYAGDEDTVRQGIERLVAVARQQYLEK
jgi:alanine-alpha-ketoisovalerate/valine-pyruvate aminotransferase